MEDFIKQGKDVVNVFNLSSKIANLLLIIQCAVFVWFVYFCTFVVFEGRFGKETVDCIVDNKDEGFVKAVSRWCLSYGLFTNPNGTLTGATSNRQRLNYYFWVPYVLTVHAFVMHLSGWIMKSKEKGVMEGFLRYFIVHGLLTVSPTKVDGKSSEGDDSSKKKNTAFGAEILKELEEKRNSAKELMKEPSVTPQMLNCNHVTSVSDLVQMRNRSIKTVANVLERRVKDGCNVNWAYSLIGCEFLNVIIQISVGVYYNYLLSGNYSNLGVSSFKRLEKIFPSLARCEFFHVGPSGSYVMKDALCVLSQNVSYRVIFFVIWWSNVAFLMSGMGVFIFRALEAVLFKQQWYLSSIDFAAKPVAAKAIKDFSYSDFLFCKYLKKNIGARNFQLVLENFSSYQKIAECVDTSKMNRELWV